MVEGTPLLREHTTKSGIESSNLSFSANSEEGKMKQIIVLRKDLGMRRGKEIAQGAHASMKATLDNLDHPDVQAWLSGNFTKIAVTCDSEDELISLYQQAKDQNMVCALITDAGRTEFNGVPTKTALAIGPAANDKIDKITGHLKLR